MATSAIVMMCIGCIGLWGGCAFSISIAMRHSKKRKIPPKRIRTQKTRPVLVYQTDRVFYDIKDI